MRWKEPQSDEGSIAMAVIVILVATSLVFAVVAVVEKGLRSSRRAGDSANALQVADAGINAAVQYIPTLPASTTEIGPIDSVVGSGKFVYSARKVDNQTWNVTSLGTDRSGLQRRITAQALAQPLFGRPIYIRATGKLHAGTTLDSYASHTARCTGQGILSFDDPLLMRFTGSGGGNANCQADFDSTWTHSMDGCEVPSHEADLGVSLPLFNNESPPKPLTGPARCPDPPRYRRAAPKMNPQPVRRPATWDFPTSGIDPAGRTFVCSPTIGTAPNTDYGMLQQGKTYYYSQVRLLDGCNLATAPSTAQPVRIFSSDITLGVNSGGSSNNTVFAPQTPFCPANWNSGSLVTGYCAKWAMLLQLNLMGSGNVTFNNKMRYFWGVINAPSGSVVLDPSDLVAWGASVSNNLTSSAQFTWHFDEALRTEIGSGFFGVGNWREEGT